MATIDYTKVIEIRKRIGLSAVGLARKLDIDIPKLQKWEQKKASPKEEDAEKLRAWMLETEKGIVNIPDEPKSNEVHELKAMVRALTLSHARLMSQVTGRPIESVMLDLTQETMRNLNTDK